MILGTPLAFGKGGGQGEHMLGWMILFALIALLAGLMNFAGVGLVAPELAGLVFTLLFVIGLATRLARGRAW